MKNKLLTIVMLSTMLISIIPFSAKASVITVNLGSVTLSGGYMANHFPEVWNLTRGDMTIDFTANLTGLNDSAGAHAWSELGIREIGAGDFNPTWGVGGKGVWLATDYTWTPGGLHPDPPPPNLDDDDKLLLARGGGLDEGSYDLPLVPPSPYDNYGFWFDRDSVDPYQAAYWGAINGGTYNTNGMYHVVITLHATNATSGTAWMTINGVQQGFYVGGWKDAPPEIYPAGLTFSGDMSRMQVFYGLYGYGPVHTVHTVVFENIMVTGTRAGPQPMEVYVWGNYNSSTPGWGYDHFAKIQDGIDGVASSGIVHVYNGTYKEEVDINKAVEVLGSGAGTTFIDGTGVVLASSGLVKITAAGDVTFSGFTVQNAPAAGGVTIGILSESGVAGITYTISYNNIYGSNDVDNAQDYGFYSQSDSANVVFTHNMVTETGCNNIVFELHTGATEISYNTLDAGIYGSDAVFVMTYAGHDVNNLQNVSYNTFNMGTGGPFDYDHRASAISFDTWPIAPDAKFTNVVIQGNTINNLQSYRRGIGFWNGGGGGGGTIAPLVTENTITGAMGSTESYGIDFIGANAATNAVVTNNTISATDWAIYLRTAGCAPGAQIHYNNIAGNNRGLDNAVGPLDVDARLNWWGDQSGPYHPTLNPAGLGNNVSDFVNFIPWLQVIHDVTVVNVSVSPTTVAAGQIVTINVTVKNLGSDYENFTVTAYYDSTAIASQNVTNLLPNWNTTLTFYWNTTGMSRGNYTIKAVASTVPGEINTANNIFINGKVQVLWHDVAVVSISSDRNWVFPGWSANINVTVKNNGDFAETANLTLYYNITASKIVGTQNVALSAGESKTLMFIWNATGLPCHNYTLTATATIPADVNPLDNILDNVYIKVRILGDLNGDGKVDGKDIALAAWSFGSIGPSFLYPGSPASPRWNPDADINRDNKIDGKDLTAIAKNFGSFCNP